MALQSPEEEGWQGLGGKVMEAAGPKGSKNNDDVSPLDLSGCIADEV